MRFLSLLALTSLWLAACARSESPVATVPESGISSEKATSPQLGSGTGSIGTSGGGDITAIQQEYADKLGGEMYTFLYRNEDIGWLGVGEFCAARYKALRTRMIHSANLMLDADSGGQWIGAEVILQNGKVIPLDAHRLWVSIHRDYSMYRYLFEVLVLVSEEPLQETDRRVFAVWAAALIDEKSVVDFTRSHPSVL